MRINSWPSDYVSEMYRRPEPCKHRWVCGLDQQQCMEECHGEHDPHHLVCCKCGTYRSSLKK